MRLDVHRQKPVRSTYHRCSSTTRRRHKSARVDTQPVFLLPCVVDINLHVSTPSGLHPAVNFRRFVNPVFTTRCLDQSGRSTHNRVLILPCVIDINHYGRHHPVFRFVDISVRVDTPSVFLTTRSSTCRPSGLHFTTFGRQQVYMMSF